MKRSRPREAAAAALIALLLALQGCAGSSKPPPPGADGAGTPSGESPFPSARELESLADTLAPDALQNLGALDVESWDLVGPFPDHIEVAPDASDTTWDSLLAEEARRRPGLVLPTEAMRCVAREIGHFYLVHRARPGAGLQRYIASRCNASVAKFRIGTIHAELPESVSEAVIFERWRESVASRLRSLTTGGACTAGIWFGRRGDRAVAMAAVGTRRVHVDPVAAVPDADGRFALTGEVLAPVAEVSAIVTRGRFGFARCTQDPGIALPRFAFACEVDPADESAKASVSYVPPGRLLGEVGLNALVWPSGRRSAHYSRPSYSEQRTVDNAVAARSWFVQALNDVRHEAGLEPLVEADAQSAIASELAPHFFAAMFGETPGSMADIVTLGMIAGWSVEGILQTGHFTAAWVTQTNDVNRLLSEALDTPVGREVLLARDVEKIAIGAVVGTDSENPTLAAVLGTYALFSESAHAANAEKVYERFQAARAKRGLRAARRLETIEPLSMEAAGMVQAGVEPREALDDLLQSSVDALQVPVNGWIAQVSDLEDLEFPEDFLSRPSLGIAVGVSYHQPEDEPWGRYVVMLVAAEPRSHRL
jgi:hypothetical protein